MHTSLLARIAFAAATVAVLLFVGAPLAVYAGHLDSLRGFPLFMLGGLLGLFSLLLGLASLYTTRPASGRIGRRLALVSSVVGAAIVAVILATAGPVASLPPINDITTDPDDPPLFLHLAEGPNAGRDMGYPAGFAAAQRDGYPDLAPIHLERPPAETFDRIAKAMQAFGWQVVARDVRAGRLEATHTSRVFRFVDDIVVRVRPDADGSLIDIRSKSREGRGDLGANAARIRQLRDAIRKR